MTETLLTSASVYRNGCIEKRTGTVYLKQGTQEIRIRGLSNSADGDSLRLSVPQGVSGSNVQLSHLSQEEKQEKLKEYSDRLDRITSLIETKEKLAALWENNADFSQKESISIGEMTSYLEKLPERLTAIGEELTALRKEKADAEKAYNEASKEFSKPYVVAELTAEQEGEYPVELSFRDYQAFWNPVYEIHAEGDNESLKLRLRAEVCQNTGEDWTGVKLTLMTGNPSVSGTIPALRPSHIRFYTPQLMSGGSARAVMGTMKMAMVDFAADEEVLDGDIERPMDAMNAVMAGSGVSVKNETMTEYQLTGKWDIRKGQTIRCDIRTDELPCRYHSVTVPKISEDVYLAAEVKTSDLEDMQETPAAVYLKGAFAGNVVLQPDMAKETYDLSLGIDETMKVKRTQKKRYTSQVLLKGQKKTEYEYEIVVTSRKEKAVPVTVTDQIPVSDEKTITVDAVELSNGKLEAGTGLIRWDLELEPKETKTLKLAYNVAWPKDKLTQES